MTEAEIERLNAIEKHLRATHLMTTHEVDASGFRLVPQIETLLALARRCQAAEMALHDLLAGDLNAHDAALVAEAGKAAARECSYLAETGAIQLPSTRGMRDPVAIGSRVRAAVRKSIADNIRSHFSLDATGPTLTQRVAAECAEIAARTGHSSRLGIVAAIRARFSLEAP